MNRFPVEITFEGVKYTFQISRLEPSLLELAIADKKCLGIFQERRASAFDPTLPTLNLRDPLFSSALFAARDSPFCLQVHLMVFHVETTTLLRVLQLPRFMAKQDIDATLEAHEKEQTISFEKPRYTSVYSI